ncbi:hypothetical protein [Embleya sp. NPDC020886]|uniref:hypothetical protein n=1 Tax=Embleya sp. NPDC020886 TaxID=3363980 RepID=UPI00379584E2
MGNGDGADPVAEESLFGYADDGLAARVRNRLGRVEVPPARLPAVDWDTVVREHRRNPLADAVRAELVVRADCPRAALLALVVVPLAETTCLALGAALAHRVVTLRQVALEGTPGWAAVRTVACWTSWAGGRRNGPVERVLDEAAGLLPGDEPIAWQWLIDRAPGHPYTFGRLCTDATNASWAGVPQRGVWSTGSGSRPAAGPTVLTPLGLLSRVPAPVAARVIAMLPVGLIHEFLAARERLGPSVIGPLLRTGVIRAEDLPDRLDTCPARAPEFLALHHSGVNAALLEAGADRRTRDAIFRATRRDAPRRVPLPAGSRERPAPIVRDGCAEAVFGHHPELIRRALGLYHTELGVAGVLRALLGICEARGPSALADPHLLYRLGPDGEIARFARSIAIDSRGPERLRAEVARHERPDALVAAMRQAPTLAVRHPAPQLWPAAVAAHDREPLPAATLAHLAMHPDCPEELSLPACRSDPYLALRLAGRSPRHAFLALDHPMPHAWKTPTLLPWFVDVLADRRLDVRDMVERFHPAGRLLETVDVLAVLLPDEARAAREVVAEHTGRTLGADPEAWVVAARMLPDFVGTLPQLLATAAAAASGRSGSLLSE